MKVLVTGANGFIGRGLCPHLKAKGYIVRGSVRNGGRDVPGVDEFADVGDINEATDWQQALKGVEVIIHLAARAHITNDSAREQLDAFRKVNVRGTEHLARMAAKAGVKRFVFISSIAVNGNFSYQKPFAECDSPVPVGAYAISKWEAEQSLYKAIKGTDMEVSILRPSLVYGPNAPGNFSRLTALIEKRIPLPLVNIKNLRSFIYLGNLIDAILACVKHPKAAGQTFLVSDGEDISTPDLIRMISSAMHKRLVLFSFPVGILRALCKLVGKGREIEKLTDSLRVDSSKIRSLVGWKPPFSMKEGIAETVKGYRP